MAATAHVGGNHSQQHNPQMPETSDRGMKYVSYSQRPVITQCLEIKTEVSKHISSYSWTLTALNKTSFSTGNE